MYSEINQSGIEDDVDELHGQIVTTASILDAIHVQVEEVLKKVGVDTKRINNINIFAVLKAQSFQSISMYMGCKYNCTTEKSDDDHIYVDDSKRVRIGTVSDTFITVTGVPGKKDPVYMKIMMLMEYGEEW